MAITGKFRKLAASVADRLHKLAPVRLPSAEFTDADVQFMANHGKGGVFLEPFEERASAGSQADPRLGGGLLSQLPLNSPNRLARLPEGWTEELRFYRLQHGFRGRSYSPSPFQQKPFLFRFQLSDLGLNRRQDNLAKFPGPFVGWGDE